MYLLNPSDFLKSSAVAFSFTFHYVSIKSLLVSKGNLSYVHLHSTMYLLNQNQHYQQAILKLYLHSTMYLLNPKSDNRVNLFSSTFTFHYVSIKSKYLVEKDINLKNLHSTMYLLNLRHIHLVYIF